jgi:hypothetical protein
MDLIMESQELWNILVNGILFYLAFKMGQISILAKSNTKDRTEITKIENVRLPNLRPIITIEEINGVYYAYDGNDFIGQGTSPDELGSLIAKRYPNKYSMAKIEFKT